uniref:DUF5675 domain-containing protein n=1 Tax=viral metagenome TaxID=1070528 RepID=A0A6M3LI99_9ZZZZ
MTLFKLIRVAYTKEGTFGVLLDRGTPFCLSIERPWLDNQKNISCIPIGIYICQRVFSPKFGNTFEVCKVLNRTSILFHKGNIMEDSHGCIILGEQYESIQGKLAVLSSGKAFSEFIQRTEDINEFELEVASGA